MNSPRPLPKHWKQAMCMSTVADLIIQDNFDKLHHPGLMVLADFQMTKNSLDPGTPRNWHHKYWNQAAWTFYETLGWFVGSKRQSDRQARILLVWLFMIGAGSGGDNIFHDPNSVHFGFGIQLSPLF